MLLTRLRSRSFPHPLSHATRGGGPRHSFAIALAWAFVLAATPVFAITKTFVVTSAASGGSNIPGTLLWAIYQSNYQGGDINYINFAIPGVTGETEIALTETLYLARPVIINAETQPGYGGQPLVRINCNGLASGFHIVPPGNGLPGGGGSAIQGFRVINYSSNAITISRGADGNLIANNQLGFAPLSLPGTYFRNTTVAPLCRGIGIESNANLVRGNTISGVDNAITLGFDIFSPSGATSRNNVFERNFIGTDPTGSIRIGNTSDGIYLGAGAQQTLIGPGNVLSGMVSAGVELLHATATDNRIFGNRIGVNAAGTDVIPNGELGILIANGAANNWVGGPYGGPYPGNVISGNGLGGVAIGTSEFPGVDGSNNNHVEGNLIGTDATGARAIGAQVSGVTVQNGSKGTVIRRNVIVGHLHHGVVLSSASNNALYGNWIGVTAAGGAFVNGSFGVYLFNASNNILQPATGGGVGAEQNVFGSNANGPFGLYGTSPGNTMAATVPTPALPRLLNISTRLQVLTNDSVLIGGFIVTGSEPKKVLIRGLGPSVPTTGRLTDTTLQLLDAGQNLLAANDNWRESQEMEIADTTVPPQNNLEAAIVRSLSPGSYTAVLRGKNNTMGVGQVEVYDLTAATASTLVNISTRGFVGLDDNVMIGGVIVAGAPARLLVRALGPSLTAQGVSGALSDTVLELRDGSGQLVATNDDWRSTQEQIIRDTTIPPPDDRESALVQTVVPGNYTAVVRGKNFTQGVGLIEIYNLP